MSDFKWEDVLNPSKIEQGLEGLSVDPRNGEPIKDPEAKRKELEALLNTLPGSKKPEDEPTAPPAAFSAPPAPPVETPTASEPPKPIAFDDEEDFVVKPVVEPPSKPVFENPPIKLDWDDEEPIKAPVAPVAPVEPQAEEVAPPPVFSFTPEPETSVAPPPPVFSMTTEEPKAEVEAPAVVFEMPKDEVVAAAPPVAVEPPSVVFEVPKAEEPTIVFEAPKEEVAKQDDGFVPPVIFETKDDTPITFNTEPETPAAPPIMEVVSNEPPVQETKKIDLAAFGVELPQSKKPDHSGLSAASGSKAPSLKLTEGADLSESQDSPISWDKADFSGLPGHGAGDAKTPFGAKVGQDTVEVKVNSKSTSPIDPSLLIPQVEQDKHENLSGEDSNPFHIVSSEAPFVHDYHMDELLRQAVERRASDVHLTVGLPPMLRVDGELVPLNYQPLRPADTRRLIYDTLGNEQLEKFERSHELDFGYMVKGLARFRFNVYMQRGSVAGALRLIPNKIPSFETLGLPPIIRELSKRSSGLVLVTGPTGSGKSTTIASMIDDINETRNEHIMTIEDPIEYLHVHKKSMVNQREMHADTYSFHDSLRAVLREDPDIILVGELRDHETIEAALTLAETGHLVFGTLHTRNAPASIDRIIDVFSADQQAQIRVLLGNTLEAVISQQLLSRQGGGRSAALEIMIGTPAIKNLIREGKTHQMYSIIETSKNIGMQTMDWCLSELYRSGKVCYDDCLAGSVDKETFVRLAKGAA